MIVTFNLNKNKKNQAISEKSTMKLMLLAFQSNKKQHKPSIELVAKLTEERKRKNRERRRKETTVKLGTRKKHGKGNFEKKENLIIFLEKLTYKDNKKIFSYCLHENSNTRPKISWNLTT